MNVWDEMRAAMDEARDRLRAADNCANDMASLLRGRLRRVCSPLVHADSMILAREATP